MRAALVSGLVGLVAGGAAVYAADQRPAVSAADRARIEAVVHDYILAHPEIVPQAMERLEAKRGTMAVRGEGAALARPFAGAWAGAAAADVTIVEFTDYACGYCRKSVADLDRLLAEDRTLRVVFREIPVLSPESDPAARTALAAAKAGRYTQVHHALFAGGQLSEEKLKAVAAAAGLSAAAIDDPTVKNEVDRNIAMWQRLGVNATPIFVVGDQLLQGAVGYDALKAAVAQARAETG